MTKNFAKWHRRDWMKAHKVPATYFSSWKTPGTKHSFYVFYKSDVNKKGNSKSYKDVDNITQEHAYFMEEDFYYLDIKKVPGLLYKLSDEINDFLQERDYKIECPDFLAEDKEAEAEYPIIEIKNYDDLMRCWRDIDKWMIKDMDGKAIENDMFSRDLHDYLFEKIGIIVEETYFANNLEPKWNNIKKEIEKQRKLGDDFCLSNKADFLEFFVIQYLRVNDFMTDDIEPVVNMFKEVFSSMGFENSELEEMKEDGLLASESFFYGTLLDVARGEKQRLQKYIDSIEQNYVMDLLKAEDGVSFITSTLPCVVMKMIGKFKFEMVFPVSPKYCIRFIGKSSVNNRSGKFFEATSDEVKCINRKIISESKNIVISESENISDRI